MERQIINYNDIQLSDQEKESVIESVKRSLKEKCTDADIEFALEESRKAKIGALKLQDYAKKVKNLRDAKPPTSDEFYDMIQKIPGFQIDHFNKEIIADLCCYFSGSDNCRLNRKKGILLQGPIGCGKTTIMRFFTRNPFMGYITIPARKIANDFARDGYGIIEKYSGMIRTQSKLEYYNQEKIGVCIDDLGTERDKNNYGNKENVLLTILSNRYDSKLFTSTHITTNLIPDEISAQYDDRLRSRMREMFNVLVFSDKALDRRL